MPPLPNLYPTLAYLYHRIHEAGVANVAEAASAPATYLYSTLAYLYHRIYEAGVANVAEAASAPTTQPLPNPCVPVSQNS